MRAILGKGRTLGGKSRQERQGNFTSGTKDLLKTSDEEARRKNEEVENLISRDRMLQRNEIKILLVGASGSGKSTILAQLRLINGVDYSREERESSKKITLATTLQAMQTILEAMESLEIDLENAENERHVKTILQQPATIVGEFLSVDFAYAIKALWKDTGLQECYRRSREYQLDSNTS